MKQSDFFLMLGACCLVSCFAYFVAVVGMSVVGVEADHMAQTKLAIVGWASLMLGLYCWHKGTKEA